MKLRSIIGFVCLLTVYSACSSNSNNNNGNNSGSTNQCVSDTSTCVAANPTVCCEGLTLTVDALNCPVKSGVVGGNTSRCVPKGCVSDPAQCVASNPTVCCPGHKLTKDADKCPVPDGAVGGMPDVCSACVDNPNICVAINPTVCCSGYSLQTAPANLGCSAPSGDTVGGMNMHCVKQ